MTSPSRDDTQGSGHNSTTHPRFSRRGRLGGRRGSAGGSSGRSEGEHGSHGPIGSVASSQPSGSQRESPRQPPPLPRHDQEAVDDSSILLPSPETLPDGRKRILVGHLESNLCGVYEDVRSIVKSYWNGWPPTYMKLTQAEQDAYASKFMEKYTWRDRTCDADDVLAHLHQLFGLIYRRKKSKILQDRRRDYPLTAEHPTYDHWRPHRPKLIPKANWDKLIDYLNTETARKASETAKANATTEAAKWPRKKHGSKRKHSMYEEMLIRERRLVSIIEFRRHWDGDSNITQFEEEYTRRIAEKYPDNNAPPWDEKIYREVTGAPTRGRWAGVPPQLVYPEHFRPSRSSQRDLAMEEERRKEREEWLRLEHEVHALKARMVEYEMQLCRQDDIIRKLEREREDLRRQYEASFSIIWQTLIGHGFLQWHQVPGHLAAGSSSQGPFQQSMPSSNNLLCQPFQQTSPQSSSRTKKNEERSGKELGEGD